MIHARIAEQVSERRGLPRLPVAIEAKLREQERLYQEELKERR